MGLPRLQGLRRRRQVLTGIKLLHLLSLSLTILKQSCQPPSDIYRSISFFLSLKRKEYTQLCPSYHQERPLGLKVSSRTDFVYAQNTAHN